MVRRNSERQDPLWSVTDSVDDGQWNGRAQPGPVWDQGARRPQQGGRRGGWPLRCRGSGQETRGQEVESQEAFLH